MSSRTSKRTRAFATLTTAACVVAVTLLASGAGAAIVPAVPLGTAGEYVVLAGATVTNDPDGISTLNGSLGLWPGTSVTGFPPGLVVPPGVQNVDNPAAQQAQADLTAAYVNAANRPIDATTTADLVDLELQAGVYAGPNKGALSLTGPLVLDGAGDPNSVFIFQTNDTLITGSSSTVSLINGAQACNVFWQVGSSATLGTGSVMVGTILALSSITVTNGVTVHGRALARNAAVTLTTTPSPAVRRAADDHHDEDHDNVDHDHHHHGADDHHDDYNNSAEHDHNHGADDHDTGQLHPDHQPGRRSRRWRPARPRSRGGRRRFRRSGQPRRPRQPGDPDLWRRDDHGHPDGPHHHLVGHPRRTHGRIWARTGSPLGLTFLLGIALVTAGTATLRLSRTRQ